MSDSARVSSIDALKAFKVALSRFGVEAQRALCTAELELRRVFDGLQAQLRHWQREARQRQEEVTRAKAALVQREWGHARGSGPGTTDQEVALRKAQQRLQEAEDKIQTVRHWQLQLPQLITEYEGPARQLAGMVEADLQQSIAILERKVDVLEAYVAMTPASGDAPPPEGPAETPGAEAAAETKPAP